jgi:hypothetical protein
LLFKIVHELFYLLRLAQFWVRRSTKQKVGSSFCMFRIFVFCFRVRKQKYAKINEHQRDGDHRPTTTFHVFMTQRNEHGLAPFPPQVAWETLAIQIDCEFKSGWETKNR